MQFLVSEDRPPLRAPSTPDPSLEDLETHSCLLTPHSPSYTHTHTPYRLCQNASQEAKREGGVVVGSAWK